MSKSTNMAKRRALVLLAMAMAIAVVAVLPAGASADFGVTPGSFEANILDSNGTVVASPQAGEHPYAQQIKFALNTTTAHLPPSPGGGFPGTWTIRIRMGTSRRPSRTCRRASLATPRPFRSARRPTSRHSGSAPMPRGARWPPRSGSLCSKSGPARASATPQ